MDRNTTATKAAREAAAAARSITPHRQAEIDEAKEGARLGRIVAERELAVSTLQTIAALKFEGRPVSEADYVIGEDHDGEPIDAREVLQHVSNRRSTSLLRTDGRMTAAELSSVVTAAARNVTAGIARRMNGATVGRLTAEDWQDLTSELTLAALAREAEAAAALRGDTLAAALRGRDHRSALDTLPRWATVKAADGDSYRSAWVKSLTANEGRTWARRRAESAKAAAAALEGEGEATKAARSAAAQEAADERSSLAAAEAAATAAVAAERLGLGKQAEAAAVAALDGLTTAERARLNGRSVESQKQAQKKGRRNLAAALGSSLAAARKTAREAIRETVEGPPLTLAALADRVEVERERATDVLGYLAESNRAFEGRMIAASLSAARSEAERYLIMRQHYGAPVVKLTCKRGPALREIGPAARSMDGRKLTPNMASAYRPVLTVSALAALPERTPAPSIGRPLAARTGPTLVTVGPSVPTLETDHTVTPTVGLPVKRIKRGEAPISNPTVLDWSPPCEYPSVGRPVVKLNRRKLVAADPKLVAAEADATWLRVTRSS